MFGQNLTVTSKEFAGSASAYLLVLADRAAIHWVLRTQQMAFPAIGASAAARLRRGDVLLLYATRGAWHNPTRDRGRVFGSAEVLSPVRGLEEPVHLAGRDFTLGCTLSIRNVVPYPGGVEIAPLVPDLDCFPHKSAWSTALRRPLVPLSAHDTSVVTSLTSIAWPGSPIAGLLRATEWQPSWTRPATADAHRTRGCHLGSGALQRAIVKTCGSACQATC